MPRRERQKELVRRRKRREERRKLRAKGLLPQPSESVKEIEKKKPEKPSTKEALQGTPKEETKEPTSEG
jgi:hypothetical protein